MNKIKVAKTVVFSFGVESESRSQKDNLEALVTVQVRHMCCVCQFFMTVIQIHNKNNL